MNNPEARPSLSPHGTARQGLAPSPAYPQALLDLMRDSDLDESSLFLVWQLAQLAPGLAAGEREAFMLLLGRLLVAQALGSTRLRIGEQDRTLLANVPDLVGTFRRDNAPPATSEPLVGGFPTGRPLVLDGDYLYAQRAHASEGRIVAALAQRLRRPGPYPKADIVAALADVVAAGPGVPSDEQRAAIVAALGRFLGIITGGPGTGKTTTALALVRTLVRLGASPASIALCAPTGKAASRLEEGFRNRLATLAQPPLADQTLLAQCPPAQTLHRLLGSVPRIGGSFATATHLLPYRVIVVDESSMIDLVLMDRLLGALATDAVLILLGDADQLPSVSAGAVFRDISGHAARLVRGFRTDDAHSAGRQLAALTAGVRAGQAGPCLALCVARAQPELLHHQGVELVASDRRDQLLRRYHRRLFSDRTMQADMEHLYRFDGGAFDAAETQRLETLTTRLARTRVLAITRQRPTGVERANAFLHDLHGGGPAFLPGEPVLMLRNDYERGLWNGDQGVAVRVQRPGHPSAIAIVFRSRTGWLPVDPSAVGEAFSLAFALTVHKSQGSEFDEVILLLPDSPSPLSNRELLYTAVSRARRSFILCGAPQAFEAGIKTSENRSSGIAERLAGATT